ncbi:MAG: TlpA family protein disulfide reductase [Labilithrix sp.]|nr:TlpA family protein disulfide reductase [Labilithrix sp.]MCW5834880.1 TlpA family protein disulfide reductase [Labilithrix sp.]
MTRQKHASGRAATLRNHADSCETPAVAGPQKNEDAEGDETGAGEAGAGAAGGDDVESAARGEATSKPTRAARAPERDAPKKRRAAREERTEPSLPLGPVAHLVFVIVAAVGVYSFVSVAKEGELRRRCTPTCILRPNYAGYEKRAPSFTLKDTRGRDVSLDSYRGKVVVLNFWTKTCGPCMEEMPEIADLSRILRSMKDVAVVTISTDETAEEATSTLKAVLKEEPPFPVLMDPELTVVRDRFGTSLYPETWIIDKSGVIRARFDGAREWSNATVVELVDQIRGGGYCPAQARDGKFVGESARLCDGMSGG